MEEFNKNILQDYFNQRDYAGAVTYLSNITPSSPEKAVELRSKIKNLERKAELQSAYLSRLDEDGVQAFHFTNGLSGIGSIPHTKYNDEMQPIPGTANSYGDDYAYIINNLRVSDTHSKNRDKTIDSIKLEINADFINAFTSNLGIKDLEHNNLGISYTVDNTGKHIVEIPTSNKSLVSALKAVKDLDTGVRLQNSFNEAANWGLRGMVGGASVGAFGGPAIIPSTLIGLGTGIVGGAVKGFVAFDSPYRIVGKGKGFEVGTDKFNADSLNNLINIVDKAKSKVEKDKSNIENIAVNEELYVTPFLGQGHANAYKMLSSGRISIDDYNKIIEERTNTYDRLLKQADLTQYEVFTARGELDDSENLVMKKVENEDRLTLMKNLSVAIKDKRVTYSAAIKGGKVGTYITIAADKDKNGDLSKGSTEQFTRIFIPGLFKSSCDESFNNDTNTITARQNAEMKKWKYGKRMHDGTYVGYCEDLGSYAIKKDANGNDVKLPISEDEILTHLHRNVIINSSVDAILNNLDKGNSKLNVEDMIDLAANAGTNELFPQDKYSRADRIYQSDMLYKHIYDLLQSYIPKTKTN